MSTVALSVVLAGVAMASSTSSRPHRLTCAAGSGPAGVSAGHGQGETHAAGCIRATRRTNTTVTASRDRHAKRWYAVYQGKPGNKTPPGYLGFDNQDGVTLVGCDTGTYNPNADDDWNQSPHSPNNNAQIALGTDEFTAPVGPVGPGDPCSPFVPHTPPGKSCGSAQNTHPAASYPKNSRMTAYSAQSPTSTVKSRKAQAGIAGNFGGGDGASGYLQVTVGPGGKAPAGNVTTGGNSRGGGGTVAVGNDGNETDDPFTPKRSPVVVCQN